METVICHAYDSTFVDDRLQLWCLDRQSNPVHVIIKNVPIYCYIELPNTNVEWDDTTVEMLFEDMKNIHGRCKPIDMKYTPRMKLYYHQQDTKSHFARVFFDTWDSMRFCAGRLKKQMTYENFGVLSFKVFENDISIRRKVFTIQRLGYAQWFKFKGIEVPFDEDIRIATPGNDFRKIREFIVNDYRELKAVPASESKGWTTKPRVLSFDIETYSDNHYAMPDRENPDHVIYMISCLFQVTNEPSTRKKYVIMTEACKDIPGAEIIMAKDEEDLLVKFMELIETLDPEIMMGYNIFGYDYPYIEARYKQYRQNYEPCGRYYEEIPTMYMSEWSSGAYGKTTIFYLNMAGRITIDLLPFIRRDYKFDKYTLDFVAGKLLGSAKHDVTAIQMFKAFESKDIDEMTRVTKYCIQDADLVIDLYQKMNVWIGLVEMASIVGVEIMELFTRGQQIRCLSQIYDLAARSMIVLDRRDEVIMDYKGGYVSSPIQGIHPIVMSFDFNSLYPSIIIAYNLCFTTLVPNLYLDDYNPDDLNKIEVDGGHVFYFVKPHIKKGLLPTLVENLVKERKNVRKEIGAICARIETLDPIEDEEEIKQLKLTVTVLDKRQLALKVSANSMYGFLGVQKNGKLPLIEAAISITSMGRKLITGASKYLEDTRNATIVYGDTDSTMISLPGLTDVGEAWKVGQEISEELSGTPEVRDSEGNIIKEAKKGIFPPPLRMELENVFVNFLGIAKKKYTSFKTSEKTKDLVRDKDGNEEIYTKGIILARRDNFAYVRKVYLKILRMIHRRIPIQDTFKVIVDAVIDLLSGKVPVRDNLTIIKGLGREYKSDTYFMKVFQDELARMGRSVYAGDRLEYVVVEEKPGEKSVLGKRLRLLEMYEDSLEYDSDEEGPRPPDVYPVEKIDYLYYVRNGMQNPIDQIFSVGYMKELFDTDLHTKGYIPLNKASKMASVAYPVKLISVWLKDRLEKEKIPLKKALKEIKATFYDWFLDMLEESKNISVRGEREVFAGEDEDDEDNDDPYLFQ